MCLEMNCNTPSNKRLNTEMDFSPEGQLTDQEKKMFRSENNQEVKMSQNKNDQEINMFQNEKNESFCRVVRQKIY